MNKNFKSVDEVNKHLDSVSDGPVGENTQPAGSVWHPQRKFDTICVKPTGRTPAEEEHCRRVQKKQLEQYPIASLKLGDTVVIASGSLLEEEVELLIDGKKILIDGPEKIDITSVLPHEFKSELADNISVQENGFPNSFTIEIDGDVSSGMRGEPQSMHGPGTPDDPPEVDVTEVILYLDKEDSGLSRDFKVDITRVVQRHPKFRGALEDKLLETYEEADPDYEYED